MDPDEARVYEFNFVHHITSLNRRTKPEPFNYLVSHGPNVLKSPYVGYDFHNHRTKEMS